MDLHSLDISGLVALVSFLITTFGVGAVHVLRVLESRLPQNVQDTINSAVSSGVEYAEQVHKVEGLSPADRENHALDYVESVLARFKINVSEDDLRMYIQRAVLNMNQWIGDYATKPVNPAADFLNDRPGVTLPAFVNGATSMSSAAMINGDAAPAPTQAIPVVPANSVAAAPALSLDLQPGKPPQTTTTANS